MKDGVITSEDVDNMIKDIKSGKTEKKAVTYSKKTRDKIKFLLIFDLIFLFFFANVNNIFFQILVIFTFFSGFTLISIFGKNGPRNFNKAVLEKRVYYFLGLFFLTFVLTIVFNWRIYYSFLGLLSLLLTLFVHYNFYRALKKKRNKLSKMNVIFMFLFGVLAVGSFGLDLVSDVYEFSESKANSTEKFALCSNYTPYENLCLRAFFEIDKSIVVDDCNFLETNSSKRLCVNYFVSRDSMNCSSIGNLSQFCN